MFECGNFGFKEVNVKRCHIKSQTYQTFTKLTVIIKGKHIGLKNIYTALTLCQNAQIVALGLSHMIL